MFNMNRALNGVALFFGLIATTLALAADGGAPADRSHEIVGEWHGTSTCVNRELAPACKDETVRYLFTPSSSGAGIIHCAAYKLVDGKFEPMGEIDLTYSPMSAAWTYDFEARQSKSQWRFEIKGDTMSGSLLDQPSGSRIRTVAATRWTGK